MRSHILHHPWIGVLLLFVSVLIAERRASTSVHADEQAASDESVDPADTDAQKKRLGFMVEAFKKFQIEVGGEDSKSSELIAKPLLRWSNPVSNVQDGIVAAFSRGGRPDVLAQFQMHRNDFSVHEFSKTTPLPLEMKRGKNVVWKPDETWIEFRPLAEAPEPANSAILRLSQMRKQADRFSVVDDFEVNQVPTPNHLRLLSQPLFRYSDVERGGDIVDGAVFSFVLGTNPEANLLLEIFKEEDRLSWRYALAPMTIFALEAKLDQDAVVWKKPSYKVFCNDRAPYYVCPYTQAP